MTSPLEGDIVVVGCRCLARSGVAAAVEKADGIGLEFDGELLNDVLDRFLAIRHLDGAIILARGEFPLHENVCAFAEAGCKLRKAVSIRDDIVPLGFVFPFTFVVFPGACSRDGKFRNGSSVR